MIYVTQGHEVSIGPEVFIKSFLELSPIEQASFAFVANDDVIKNTLNSMGHDFTRNEDHFRINNSKLKTIQVDSSSKYLSTTSLEIALSKITDN